MSGQVHPMTPQHLPFYMTEQGGTDYLMVAMGIFLIAAVLAVGNFYLHLHTLPERMAHKSQKMQFEIVAVLGLLALFTHIHLFWIAGLMLALIDLPDFGTPLRSIAGSVEKIAGSAEETDAAGQAEADRTPVVSEKAKSPASREEVRGHA
jgi:hypothetical protein